MSQAIEKIIAERSNQDAKWGEQNHDDYVWLAILSEEVGEAAQAILKTNDPSDSGEGVWSDEHIEVELIQSAAVILAWLECRERRKREEGHV